MYYLCFSDANSLIDVLGRHNLGRGEQLSGNENKAAKNDKSRETNIRYCYTLFRNWSYETC